MMLKKDLGPELVEALRLATLILLIDRLAELDSAVTKGFALTWSKISKAAERLHLASGIDPQELRSVVVTAEWRSIVSLIEHQLSYLRAVQPKFDPSNMAVKEPRI